MPLKLQNPLNSPWAMVAGGIVLVVGVRVIRMPSIVVVPVAGAIAASGAVVLGKDEQEQVRISDPILAQEINQARQLAQTLSEKALVLQGEAQKLLQGESFQMDLLSAVEYATLKATQLPENIESMASRFEGDNSSLLSVDDLQTQLATVQHRRRQSTGPVRQQLDVLAQTLEKNTRLAEQGEDARHAQTIALVAAIQQSAGALQALQNQLRGANFNDSAELDQLRSLSADLSSLQDNVDLLVQG